MLHLRQKIDQVFLEQNNGAGKNGNRLVDLKKTIDVILQLLRLCAQNKGWPAKHIYYCIFLNQNYTKKNFIYNIKESLANSRSSALPLRALSVTIAIKNISIGIQYTCNFKSHNW